MLEKDNTGGPAQTCIAQLKVAHRSTCNYNCSLIFIRCQFKS